MSRDTCEDFKDTTGACLNCVSKIYELNPVDGICIRIVVTCGANQYVGGLECKDIPPECTSFNAQSETCTECVRGISPTLLASVSASRAPTASTMDPSATASMSCPLWRPLDSVLLAVEPGMFPLSTAASSALLLLPDVMEDRLSASANALAQRSTARTTT